MKKRKRNLSLHGNSVYINKFLILWLLSCLATGKMETRKAASSLQGGHFLNQFSVRLKNGSRTDAEKLAFEYSLVIDRHLSGINVFVLTDPKYPKHRKKRNADKLITTLRKDIRFSYVQQEEQLVRVKRAILYDKQLELPIEKIADSRYYRALKPQLTRRGNIYGYRYVNYTDPMFKDMWYLVNRGQSGGEIGIDMNIDVVWNKGITGKGIVVSILDDGVDHTHPDLRENYDAKASTDLNDKMDKSRDPMPNIDVTDDGHGTRCAGEVAASANNGVCGVGIAYNAKIGGVRLLDGVVTDALEAEALTFNNDYIDIYSASWGPADDGTTMEGPKRLALEALRLGAKNGRKGRGSIYIWATGNGGTYQDDCSADGYVSLPETLSIGSVNDYGRSPAFMEKCSSTMSVVPSGGEDYFGQEKETGRVKLKVITTDMNGGCIENFQGTSSAAPLAAGCIANVLQANPRLSWRDVQHIVVKSSRVPSIDDSWIINGAGHHVSHKFGFGLMDCGRMVELAQTWKNVPTRQTIELRQPNERILQRNGNIRDTLLNIGSDNLSSLEHVQVKVKIFSEKRGDLQLLLVSPLGTRSTLLRRRNKDIYSGDWSFTFMTVHCWDEAPVGNWTLEVSHESSDKPITQNDRMNNQAKESNMLNKHFTDSPAATVHEWSLILHGSSASDTTITRKRQQRSYKPTLKSLSKVKATEAQQSRNVKINRISDKDNCIDEKLNEEQNYIVRQKQRFSNLYLDTRYIQKRKLAYLNDNYSSSGHNSTKQLLISLIDNIISLLQKNNRINLWKRNS